MKKLNDLSIDIEKTRQILSDFIREKTGWQVVVPAYQDEIVLD